MISTIGMGVLVLSMVPFLVNVVRSLRRPATAGADPWHANSLEWATSSPPPEHNFAWLPPIRSERPVFDLRWIDHDDVSAAGTRAACVGASRGRAVRLEMMMWAGVGVFYVVIGALYWLVDGDPAGASLLLTATAIGGLCAGWIWDWRRHHAPPATAGPRRRRRRATRPASSACSRRRACARSPSASASRATVLGVVLGSWMTIAGVAIVASQVALLARDADR